MSLAGKISGLVIQALRYLGKEHIHEQKISILRRKLNDEDKKALSIDASFAPYWIARIIREQIVGN